ncbi:4-(cytidine 5'-diphospho)-2-C-methyl-D-erythritol kinase [Cryptosporangium aurantiacum]|uniref:4-diphosphocytidyl-2-C-methyl-D-erythritol kinase n=1 Tax=Cryptosporangium aurantiacum TaxID=134849 RepID=A0A1M7RJN8_9ACTN|nr:4-(cytidine 5'-diphospho)-2-C-methyl-D-erythritol kinase [Cryptosporangium aurantiacum]SHN46382.1 4-diphosphocytidyl-2-C-methyl-D-erythritol kinase [Cryptosporangium aurantiacum]
MEEYPLTVPSRSAVRVRVPAKINLHLGVGPLRDDKFHDLATVFHAVSLHDELTLEPGPPGVRLILDAAAAEPPADRNPVDDNPVDGVSTDGVPTDERNLAVRALHALAAAAKVEPAVTVRLRKGIPVAGGMAGGSADAAAALLAGDALWNLATPIERLHALAAGLGSDVPFALHGGDALGTGRGERLAPLSHPYRRHWVLAVAGEGLSTPAVYAETDRLRGADASASDPTAVVKALDDPDPTALAEALCNDLQAAALSLRPELADVLAAGRTAGALGGIVSGSGPTCAFLAADAAHAERIAQQLRNAAVPGVSAVLIAHGPVEGARLTVED